MHFRNVKVCDCNKGNVEMRQKLADSMGLPQAPTPTIIP